ncbi:hypothetical protein [Xanthomonas sp. WHRI 7945]|nr:hypothetical protein [Xanthomonas campestris pv. campestris]
MRFEASVAHAWLQLAERDAIVCDPLDIAREAQANLWAFSPREDQNVGIETESVTRFVEAVAASRHAALIDASAPAMTFYCWHDRQVRQLRFSLVSSSHGRLPFARAPRAVALRDVVASVVHDDWLNPAWGAQDDSGSGSAPPAEFQAFVLALNGRA